ncbi:unnamed protein product [Coccothraustes coccothraustes]
MESHHGRDLSGAPGATSLLQQGHLRAQGTGLCPDGSGIPPMKEIPSLSGQSVEVDFPPAQVEPPGLSPCPFLWCHCRAPGAEPGPCSEPSLQTGTPRAEGPSRGWTAPAPSAFPVPKPPPQPPLQLLPVSLTLRIPGLDTGVAGCGLEPAVPLGSGRAVPALPQGALERRAHRSRRSIRASVLGSLGSARPALPVPRHFAPGREGKGRDPEREGKGEQRKGRDASTAGAGSSRGTASQGGSCFPVIAEDPDAE